MVTGDGYILFYGTPPFSNFTKCNIEWDGEVFCSVEQLFQYRKAIEFGDNEIARLILNTDSPSRAKSLGKSVKGFNKEHWDSRSYNIMKECVEEKFNQNPRLLNELLKWKNGEFAEASPRDNRWGIGFGVDKALQNKSKWGLNWLGKILTEIRDNN